MPVEAGSKFWGLFFYWCCADEFWTNDQLSGTWEGTLDGNFRENFFGKKKPQPKLYF
jgi:hypothetical protein